MRLLTTVGLAVVTFYIGKWTNDYWLAVGLFIGGFIGLASNWQEEPVLLRHIELDAEDRETMSQSYRQTEDKSLFNTVLCLLGVAWLLGGDENDD